MIIPDTNLLMYAFHEDDAAHERAAEWWQDLVRGTEPIGLPWVVTTGFIRLSTNPRMLARPISIKQSLDIVDEWFSYRHVQSLNPGTEHQRILRGLLETVGVGGNLVTDAHIAALAIEHRAELHSNDSDFARFPDLQWRNPLTSQTH